MTWFDGFDNDRSDVGQITNEVIQCLDLVRIGMDYSRLDKLKFELKGNCWCNLEMSIMSVYTINKHLSLVDVY